MMNEATSGAGKGSKLPPGWSVHFSKTFQKNYYFNSKTGEKMWDPPRTAAATSSAPRPPPSRAPAAAAASSSQQIVQAKRSVKKAPATKVNPSSFLGGMLSKISTSKPASSSLQLPSQRKAAGKLVDGGMEKTGDNKHAEFEKRIREEMENFVKDGLRTALAFAPCPPERREIIHDIALDFFLISRSDGVDDERHVIAYKDGHAPEEEGLPPLDANGVPVRVAVATSKKRKAIDELPQADALQLRELEKSTRDRRTIEEIQADMKRQKVDR